MLKLSEAMNWLDRRSIQPTQARNTTADGPDAPRDLEGDGMITIPNAMEFYISCSAKSANTVLNIRTFNIRISDFVLRSSRLSGLGNAYGGTQK